jgi:hypothetical protein
MQKLCIMIFANIFAIPMISHDTCKVDNKQKQLEIGNKTLECPLNVHAKFHDNRYVLLSA